MRDRSANLDEFLASLEQTITIELVHGGTLSRAAQMSQRTNQFNLTTHRYTVGDIEHMMNDPAVEVYTLAVSESVWR